MKISIFLLFALLFTVLANTACMNGDGRTGRAVPEGSSLEEPFDLPQVLQKQTNSSAKVNIGEPIIKMVKK